MPSELHEMTLDELESWYLADDNGSDFPAFMAEIRRRSVVPGWMPIETAPKDVNWVLLFIPGHVPPVAQATWDAGSWWVFGDSIAPKPTHWMPLPKPPAISLAPEAVKKEVILDAEAMVVA